ncbi:glyoxalase [Devosia geojensis]|uniref:Glyoxalase n=1 Tax=Devosia geojensis TaxID=443610 RepID=A0A0F5FI70_9HYPH|nr:VOC family protein [Devosia geojensis]KKB08508.1 glyoxalase [Devosia geojensis]
MFERLDCVCIHTDDLEKSLTFLADMGLTEAWRLDRALDDGRPWTLIGLDFSDRASSQLVLSTHPDRRDIDVEIRVADVRAAYETLRRRPGVQWLAEPFPIEEGHVAVMTAPDGNIFVLIGS